MSLNHETYRVCGDCLIFLANGPQDENTPERDAEIVAGIERLQSKGGHLSAGDNPDDFSWVPCECCLTTLGGARHDAHLLTPEPNFHGYCKACDEGETPCKVHP